MKRCFLIGVEGVDTKGCIRRGDVEFTSYTGNLSFDDIRLAKRQFCDSIDDVNSNLCTIINIHECKCKDNFLSNNNETIIFLSLFAGAVIMIAGIMVFF